MYVYTSIYRKGYIYLCIYIYTHIQIDICVYICVYTYIYGKEYIYLHVLSKGDLYVKDRKIQQAYNHLGSL